MQALNCLFFIIELSEYGREWNSFISKPDAGSMLQTVEVMLKALGHILWTTPPFSIIDQFSLLVSNIQDVLKN